MGWVSNVREAVLIRIVYMCVIGRTVEWDPRIHALYKPLSLSEAEIYEQMGAHSHGLCHLM